MKQLLITYYYKASVKVAEKKRELVERYDAMAAEWHKLQEDRRQAWAELQESLQELWTALQELGRLIYHMAILPAIFAWFVIFVGSGLPPLVLDLTLSLAFRNPAFGITYSFGAAEQVRRVTSRTFTYCNSRLLKASIALGLARFATNQVLRRLSSNLNLCNETTGSSPSRGSDCSVCWDVMEPDQTTITHEPCQNSWHATCIEEIARYEQGQKGWVPCPFCRQPMNGESTIRRTVRNIPSNVEVKHEKLGDLSRQACQISTCLGVIAIAVFLARHRLTEDQIEDPTRLLILPPALLTTAVVCSAAALTLEKCHLIQESRKGWPNLAKLLVNAACLMALTVAGRHIEVPNDLSLERLLEVGLRPSYSKVPSLVTVNMWEWMGDWYADGVGYASAGLVAVLGVVGRVVVFTYA